jgi:hypothetical protein
MKPTRISPLLLLLLAALSILAPRRAEAQLSRADSAAVLLVAALDFETQDAPQVAAALYRRIIERFADTPAAADAQVRLDRLVAQGLATRTPPDAAGRRTGGPLDDEDTGSAAGRVELQVWSTLYGSWLGIAIPAAFGADGSEAYGAGLLVGAPAGFFAGRTAARRSDLSMGQVRAITLGGSWGTWQGFGWREVFDIGVDEICPPETPGLCYEDDGGEQEVFASMVLGGLTGLAAGALIARRDISSAAATGANLGSLWGTWVATALGVIADQEGDGLLTTALVGGNAGLVAGGLATPALGWSRSRWRTVSIAGVLGGVGGLGIDLLVQPDDEKVALAIPLITSVAGFVTGVLTSSDGDGARGVSDGSAPALSSVADQTEPGAARDARSPGDPLVPALFAWRDGSLSLGTPLPQARREVLVTPRGVEQQTLLGFEWMRITF